MSRRLLAFALSLIAFPAAGGINLLSPTGPSGAWAFDVAYVDGGAALATTQKGLYRSTDHGANWTRIATASPASSMQLAVNPANRRVVLWRSDAYVSRSADGGLTWTQVSNYPAGVTVAHSPLLFSDDGSFAWATWATWANAGVSRGLLRSADGGATWTEVAATGLTGAVYSLYAGAGSAQVLYATTENGAFRSDDAGATFTSLTLAQYVNTVVPSRAVAGVAIAVATGPGVEVSRAWRSADAGATWVGPGSDELRFLRYVPGVAGKAYATTSTERLLLTLDDGATWNDLGPLPNGTVRGMTFDPTDPMRMLIAAYGGVFASADGGVTWSERVNGLREGLQRQVVANRIGDGTMYLMSNDLTNLWRRTGSATTWEARGAAATPLLGPSAGWNSIGGQNVLGAALTDPNLLYLARDGRFAASTDGGATWTRRADTPIPATTLAVTPLASQVVYVGAMAAVPQRSVDGGASWSGLGPAGLPVGARFFAFDPVNPLVVYAAGDDPGSATAFVYKSIDGGLTFNRLSWTPPANMGVIWTLVHDPVRSDIAYLSAYNGIFRTADGGTTWNTIAVFSDTLTQGGALSLEIDPLRPDVLYAGSWSRMQIARSVDAGQRWDVLGSAELTSVNGLALVPGTRTRIVAGTAAGAHEIEFMPNLRLSHPGTVVRPHAASTIVFEIANVGEVAASDVRFIAPLPSSSTALSATTGAQSCTVSGTEITCALGIVARGETKTVTVNFTPGNGDSWIPCLVAYESDTAPLDNLSIVLVTAPASPVGGGSGGGGGGGGGALDSLLLLGLLAALARSRGIGRRPG